MRPRTTATTALLLPALVLASGCFTRDERIVIRPDGSALVRYTVEEPSADADADAGDGRPAGSGWQLIETRKEKDRTRRVWENTLQDLNDYPATLGRPDDARAALFLTRETRLEVETREDRTVYRFERRYRGRDLGLLQTLRKALVTSELAERAEKNGAASLSPEEREELFSGLADYEQIAVWSRWRNALGRVALESDLTVDAFVAAMTALQEKVEERFTGDYLRQFFSLSEAEQKTEHGRLRDEMRAVIESSIPPGARERVRELIDDDERRMAVTEDIADDTFGLTVEMPGVVLTTNGLADMEEVSWQFSGEELLGADVVARATSVRLHDTDD